MRKRIFGLGVGLGVLALAGAVWGQASGGVVTINGGRNTILMRAPSEPFVPATTASSKLVKIYSNLGKGSNVYNSIAGVGILGPDAGSRGRSRLGADSGPRPIIR